MSLCHHDVNIEMVITMAPPKKDTEALTLRLSRSMIDAIDERRRLEADIPTRPEMIRRVLEKWLQIDTEQQ
ncbi:ribbon-helix-helix protein, CopG family [Paracoccus marcusii]